MDTLDENAFPDRARQEVRYGGPRMSRPRFCTWLEVLLWFQVAASAVSGWLMLYLALEEEGHGREAGLVKVAGCAFLVVTVVLAVCAVLLGGWRLSWPRYTVLLIEVLVILFWFVTLATEGTGDGTGMPPVIPVIVVLQLCRRELAGWYDGTPHRRR